MRVLDIKNGEVYYEVNVYKWNMYIKTTGVVCKTKLDKKMKCYKHEKVCLKDGMKSKEITEHAWALSTALPCPQRCVHDLVEPSHLRLESRHSDSVRRTRRKVEFTSAVLFEIICEQIFLVIVQSIQEREKMCFVPQHQLGGNDRSIGRLANDERRGIIECLNNNDGDQHCICVER